MSGEEAREGKWGGHGSECQEGEDFLHVGEDWNGLWEGAKGFGELTGRNI